MRGTKSFIHKSNKNGGRNSDAEKLDKILDHLNLTHNFSTTREPIIEDHHFSTRNCIRNPDIKVKFGDFYCYVELDGKVHQTLDEPTEKTLIRNSDYERTNTPYIILNESDALEHNLDLCDLVTYLISYEHTKQMARAYP